MSPGEGQRIWEVHDLRLPSSQTYVRLVFGNDYETVFQQVLGLTGIPRDKLALKDTGRIKPPCTSCSGQR